MAKLPPISKMEAVRKTLAELGNDAMPGKIQEYVKKTYGVDMSTAHISNYKTYILRKKPKKATEPKAAPSLAPAKAARTPAQTATRNSVSLQDVETVKALVGRVGEKNLKSLIDLVG